MKLGPRRTGCDMAKMLQNKLTTTEEPSSTDYEISIKDGIVIGFMLGLWFYSLFLMFRAWSKILNFSDSQAPQPEKGALLWKWLMEHIKHKKEQKEKEEQEKLDDEERHHREELAGTSEAAAEASSDASTASKSDSNSDKKSLQNLHDVVIVHENSEVPIKSDFSPLEENLMRKIRKLSTVVQEENEIELVTSNQIQPALPITDYNTEF